MNSWSLRFSRWLVLLLLLALPSAVRCEDEIEMGKFQNSTQTGPITLAPSTTQAYQFEVDSSTAVTVTPPGGTPTAASLNSASSVYQILQDYFAQATMDSAYPDGTYVITPTVGSALDFPLTGDLYPAAPLFQNAYWDAGGNMLLDPTKDNTVQFTAFATYATAGVDASIEIKLFSSTGAVVLDQSWFRADGDAVPSSYTIPAGTMTAGETYGLRLAYYTYLLSDGATLPNTYLSSGYGTLTLANVLANPPPVTPLVIVTQPVSETAASGTTAVLTFLVTSSPNPTYQWYFNSLPIQATGSSLVIRGATQVNAGTYYCVASNGSSSVQSNSVVLTVSASPDRGRLVNISCRAPVGTGANILIAGFAIGGAGTSGPESLLLRASGPALAGFGVTGTLPDPQQQIYTGSTLLQSNTSWMGGAAISTAAAQVGAFAWTVPASHDAALVSSRYQGAYTAQVSGESGDSGVALAEIYDDTPAGGYTPSTPRIVNISARVQVGTGGDILIAGFVIGGATSETVLIRASGPALAAFGVAGTLPDPQLQLYSGQTVLGENAGWGGSTQIASAASSVGAFAWSAASLDSALLVTLPPGPYTAQVAGLSGDTGVALIEVYEVP